MVLEGPGLYRLGVIDLLQEWNLNKRLERFAKVTFFTSSHARSLKRLLPRACPALALFRFSFCRLLCASPLCSLHTLALPCLLSAQVVFKGRCALRKRNGMSAIEPSAYARRFVDHVGTKLLGVSHEKVREAWAGAERAAAERPAAERSERSRWQSSRRRLTRGGGRSSGAGGEHPGSTVADPQVVLQGSGGSTTSSAAASSSQHPSLLHREQSNASYTEMANTGDSQGSISP